MTAPQSPQRRIIPPPMAEVPALPMRKPSRWKRNLLVWGVCAIVVIAAVVIFVNMMVPPEMQRMLAPYRK